MSDLPNKLVSVMKTEEEGLTVVEGRPIGAERRR